MSEHRVIFANIFGDARAEQIWVDEDQNGSEVLKVGVPTGERQNNQVPKYSEVALSRESRRTDDHLVHYKISDFGTTDFDGDGHLDFYYNYTEMTDDLRTQKRSPAQPAMTLLFHNDIKEKISKDLGIESEPTPPEETPPTDGELECRAPTEPSEEVTSDVDFRVWRLESTVRRLEWDLRDQQRITRDLDRRLSALEK